MRTVLAALDTSAAARSVIEAACGVARLMGASVAAVHVREDSAELPEWVSSRHDVPLRVVDGPVLASLLDAVAEPGTIAAVFGARVVPRKRGLVGHAALHVLERASKPIVVVGPDATAAAGRPLRRLLLPLEGDERSSRAVAESLFPLIVDEVELVVLHVFTEATVPRTLDRPGRDLLLWGDEFLARFCPSASGIELRSGAVGGRVAELCREDQADLVVLSWSQDSSPGHAAVVHDVLAHSTIPVLLLPAGDGAHQGD